MTDKNTEKLQRTLYDLIREVEDIIINKDEPMIARDEIGELVEVYVERIHDGN